MSNIGRNDPCPCGSGKKYKKCCLLKEAEPAGREESIKSRLVGALINQLRTISKAADEDILDEAFDEFWGDFDTDLLSDDDLMTAEINFNEWVVFDWVNPVTGKSLIDSYIEAARVLPMEDRTVLEMMRSATLSLFEVQEVFPEEGMLLKDLLLGGEYVVREKAASASLRKWDIFAARIHEVDGQSILSGSAYPYPLSMKARMLEEFKLDYQDFCAEDKERTMRDFLKTFGGQAFNYHWCDLRETPQTPILTNTDGHLMVLSRAYFDFESEASVLSELRSIKSLGEIKDEAKCFTWAGKKDKEGKFTILGNLFFENNRLVLETNSKERLKKGKALIKKHVPHALHSIDRFEDLDLAVNNAQPGNRQGALAESSAEELPPEIENEIYQEYMDKHYRQWMKDRIPALGDKTPKQAMQSKQGRAQVIELLKFMENAEEGKKRSGQPYYDFGWMRDELGVNEDE